MRNTAEKAGISLFRRAAMTDPFGRTIDYLRISVTDRCSLRCRYCMPKEGVPLTAHENILTYEELLLIAEASVGLGIDRFKITGGAAAQKRLSGFYQAAESTSRRPAGDTHHKRPAAP